jgi:CubicO group peptidase (beta-lactamase class C family)
MNHIPDLAALNFLAFNFLAFNFLAVKRLASNAARRPQVLLAAVIVLMLTGCAAAPEPARASDSVPDTLQQLARRHHVCAVALAVIRNRRLASVEVATGCAHAPTPTPDSVFQAASLSKPVFAYAVLKLVAQGKMGLDTPVLHYLPQGYRHQFDPMHLTPAEVVTDARLQAVTVRMILNHTSGLPNWAGGALSFDATPGTRWGYSGEAYVMLQRAVEAVTGEPLDRFMRAHVFAPLAMNDSGYISDEHLVKNLLPGTKANGAPRSTPLFRQPIAAFSLYTSAADYAKFMVAVLNDAELMRLVSASAVTVDPRLGLDWGQGWGIERVKDARYLWQWGNNMGYRAFAMASIDAGDGFVMLTNSENGLALAQPVALKILPGEHTLFQSSILGSDIVNMLCNTVGICL